MGRKASPLEILRDNGTRRSKKKTVPSVALPWTLGASGDFAETEVERLSVLAGTGRARRPASVIPFYYYLLSTDSFALSTTTDGSEPPSYPPIRDRTFRARVSRVVTPRYAKVAQRVLSADKSSAIGPSTKVTGSRSSTGATPDRK